MKKFILIILSIILSLLIFTPLKAQDSAEIFKEQFVQQLDYTGRVVQLADAMPADTYSWRPMEGVSSVGEVYTHIAQANYSMMGALGVSPPEGVDVESIGSLTDKDEIVEALREAFMFVKAAVLDLPGSKLTEKTEFYGQTVPGQSVLISIISHMSEHVGQSIAYARTNNVVPPWSE